MLHYWIFIILFKTYTLINNTIANIDAIKKQSLLLQWQSQTFKIASKNSNPNEASHPKFEKKKPIRSRNLDTMQSSPLINLDHHWIEASAKSGMHLLHNAYILYYTIHTASVSKSEKKKLKKESEKRNPHVTRIPIYIILYGERPRHERTLRFRVTSCYVCTPTNSYMCICIYKAELCERNSFRASYI